MEGQRHQGGEVLVFRASVAGVELPSEMTGIAGLVCVKSLSNETRGR